ncbi:low molecular weight phosphotyrosine protein phosphatase [Parasulfuritortus cantonensis]|uniref:Low molecular weight phosphotyrosine protein phosphatase n=1 Tax=Parasulfuritortus cantonensis TaxID=2528202 RepID=A0A4R1BQD1_9PROT|nr:low molecular weight protein-tyrosine-phosphatase [Parasulfuritortus cantonensis]TCJ19758.1 low molecular weight phosphotyrosine protein phosphatase [Parasulfuritortus cantonensis]
MNKLGILFVCMGNICRSPTAEGVVRKTLRDAGMADRVHLDSAGTHGYHVGSAPDPRASEAAAERGYDLSGLVGRQVTAGDFQKFDLILAMDRDNLVNLLRICPRGMENKVRLFLSFARYYTGQEVPDPYYGGQDGFARVLDMVEDAAEGLVEEIRRRQA